LDGTSDAADCGANRSTLAGISGDAADDGAAGCPAGGAA
jgi:hypothetical protein